jgi:hypothetical protein
MKPLATFTKNEKDPTTWADVKDKLKIGDTIIAVEQGHRTLYMVVNQYCMTENPNPNRLLAIAGDSAGQWGLFENRDSVEVVTSVTMEIEYEA